LKKLEKRTFYLIIMMIVLVLELLATAVQSTIISAKMCLYPSTNGSCAEEPFDCLDAFDIDTCLAKEEEDDEHCYGMTCDQLKFDRPDISWDTCHTTSNPGGDDGIATCEDDGVTRCHGEDICIEVCGFSNSGTCPSCFESKGLTVPGYDCDDYRTHVLLQSGWENLTDFEECVLHNGSFFKVTGCPKASPTNSSMDDDVISCHVSDICFEVCGFSNSDTCASCIEYSGITVPGYDCDDYRTHVLLQLGWENLTDFEECFLDDGVFFKITGCPKASPPTASPTKSSKKKRSIDIGLIVGIVVSVAVLISAIVTVIIVKRSQAIKNEAESEKAKSSIEVARVKHAIQA